MKPYYQEEQLCQSPDRNPDTSNRPLMSKNGSESGQIITDGKGVESPRKVAALEHSDNTEPSQTAPAAEKQSGIISTETRRITTRTTSHSFADDAICKKTADSSNSDGSPKPITQRRLLPDGIKPYYLDEQSGIAIICGDCREILPTLASGSIDLVVTDPPYGVQWQSHRREVSHAAIANDDDLEWLPAVFLEVYRVMKADRCCISFYGWPDADAFVSTWKSSGFAIKSHFVWVKNNFGLGWFTRGQHESAYLLVKGTPGKPQRAISDVLEWVGTGNELHPTQKPVGAITPIISAYSQDRHVVLDPFMGSGTTLVAAKDLGRQAIGIEIEEKYCEIAAKRLSQGVLSFEPSRGNVRG